ncbi:hypothetical protein A4X13_0g9614, partial [Tilletia indica]
MPPPPTGGEHGQGPGGGGGSNTTSPPPPAFWQHPSLQPGARFSSFSGPSGGGPDGHSHHPGPAPTHMGGMGHAANNGGGGGGGSIPFFPGPGDMQGAAAHINGLGADSNLGDDEEDYPLPPKRKRGSRHHGNGSSAAVASSSAAAMAAMAAANESAASATEGYGGYSNAGDSDSAGPSGRESGMQSGLERKRSLDVPPLQLIDTGNPEADAEANRVLIEEDKRRRNTAASARFRIKKKQREAALETSAKEMTSRIRE